MNNYLILHEGFKKPSDDEMAAWQKWFGMIKDIQVDRGGFRGGLKITNSGTDELPFGEDSLTGYTVIEAENIDEARDIAAQCPIVKSTLIYQIYR